MDERDARVLLDRARGLVPKYGGVDGVTPGAGATMALHQAMLVTGVEFGPEDLPMLLERLVEEQP